MKKIVLGVATVLLSLGLLAGCNNDDVDDKINNTGPEENEPTDDGNEGTTDTGPGPEEEGSGSGGSGENPGPVEELGSYWLGYKYGESTYYFDGTIASSYYGSMADKSAGGVLVTLSEATEGYTLSFTDESGDAQYIYTYAQNGYFEFGVQSEVFVWDYDTDYEAFVVDFEGTIVFLGNNYTGSYPYTYHELRVLELAELSDDDADTYIVATLMTPAEPESITITGQSKIAVEETVTFTAAINEGAPNTAFTWSAETVDTGVVTVTQEGEVTGVTAGTAKVIATSVSYPEVAGEFEVEVTEEATLIQLEITADYIVDNFARDNTDGHGDKYNLGSDGSETDSTNTQTDVIGGVTMDFGVFDVEWVNGNTNTKLWNATAGHQIRVYYNNGGFKVTPHTGWTLTGLSATDTNGKLAAYTLSTISGTSSTNLVLNTDYTITNSNKQLDMTSSFSTTDTLFVCNAATSSNRSDFTSIIVTCEAAEA